MTENKQELNFKSFLEILRNDESHLTGEDALYELTYLLIFKLIEDNIDNTLNNKDNRKIYDSQDEEDKIKIKLLIEKTKFNKFLNYAKSEKKNKHEDLYIINTYNNILSILSKNNDYKNIFNNFEKTNIKQEITLQKILIKLSELSTINNLDILGEAYEQLFIDEVYGSGKKSKSSLGQFFTPPKIKNLLINLVNPKIKENNEIESVLDPSSGTGGILINVIKHYKNITKDKIDKENLTKQFNTNIYGIEVKGKVYNLCLANMLINSGKLLKNIKCNNSITKFQNIKVDTIIANPPFSISIKYNEINQNGFPKDYLPINVGGKNSELLFIQMMIYCLNINGRCATVMLDGSKIYSNKSNYHKVREYLMKTCELHEVISCPAGSFTSTGAKTCILHFTKKKNGTDIMTEEKKSKSKKITNVFINEHMTKTVKFYKFDNDTEEKIYLGETDINNIIEKKYSLRYEDYKIEEKKELKSCEYEIKSLGEICEFKRGDQLSKENFKSGNFPVIGSGKKPVGFHNEYNRDENTILCASSGTAGLISRYITKVWASDCFSINSKDKNILNEDYLYYYLLNIQDKIYSLAKGATHKHIYPKDFDIFQIPIPSLEKQNMIVEYLDLNNKSLEQIELIKLKQKKYLDVMNIFENNYKSLSEICEFKKGNYNSGDMNNNGNIPFYSCKANNPSGFHDEFSFDYPEYLLLILAGGSQNNLIGENVGMGKCYYVKGKNACMSGICALIPKNNEINIKYIYYYLVFNRLIINKYAKFTTSLGSIAKSDIEKIQIPIPSLEKQNAIVEYLDHNEHIIKLLKKDIELNNNQYNLIIKNYKL
jgi:type I restriction-modification system DNA methylase subunit